MKSKLLVSLFAVLLFSINISTRANIGPKDKGQFVLKCFGCHGRAGISGYTDFPNLAGQNLEYLFGQLKDFRDHKRDDVTMSAMPYMVEGMSDDDVYGLADIFKSFPAEIVMASEMSEDDIKLFELGKKLINSNETTCRFCHLSNATQDGPASPMFPSLTGQQKGYLINQINAFKTKARWNPIMNQDLVATLSDEDVEAIAVYFRYLRARANP